MRTSINQGRIQSLAVMIVVLINNDQTPYLTYYRILGLKPLEDLEFHKIIAIFQRLAGPHQKSHDPRDAWASI